MASNKMRKIEDSEGGGRDLGRANWSKELLHTFCDLCMERIQRSIGKHGLRMSWKALEAEFQRKTNIIYTKNQLKNKWDWMKYRWILWKALKGNEKELGWDHEKGTISASEEWWRKKIQENVQFKAFREDGIEPELEYKMEQLFGVSVVQEECELSPAVIPGPLVLREVETENIPSPEPVVNVANGCDGEKGETNGFINIHANGNRLDNGRDHSLTRTPTLRSAQNEREKGRRHKRISESDASENSRSVDTDLTTREMLMDQLNLLIQTIANGKRRQLIPHEPAPSLSDSVAKLTSIPGLTHGSPEFSFACSMIEDPQKRIILHFIPDDNSRLQWIKFLYEEREKLLRTQKRAYMDDANEDDFCDYMVAFAMGYIGLYFLEYTDE